MIRLGWQAGLILIQYVRSDPIGYRDPTGLQVSAVFNKTTGVLTVTELDTGTTVSAKAFSGTPGLYYTAPNGAYTISDFPWGSSAQDHYFAILRHDARLDDYAGGFPSYYDPTKPMGHLRLHAGYASFGCVTVSGSPDSPEWKPIEKMLMETSRGDPVEIGGRSFPNYGTLEVTGDGYGSYQD